MRSNRRVDHNLGTVDMIPTDPVSVVSCLVATATLDGFEP